MPELPEVETIRKGLQKFLLGHKIVSLKVITPSVFDGDAKSVIGGKIIGVRRFAKVLSIDLDNGYSIVIHIKLTGQLIYRGVNLKNPPVLSKKVVGGLGGKHTHVVFVLDRDSFLYYSDFRKFGWVRVIDSSKVLSSQFIGKLGPEPFGDLTLDKFREILRKSKTSIKVLLMDQKKIGGIGNIYANDALLLAKIHPKRAANSLNDEEQELLYRKILSVLEAGLRYRGASELSYVLPDGAEGEYQRHFAAYGREGKVCSVCGKDKIVKITVGGRGTYYCPNCQKL